MIAHSLTLFARLRADRRGLALVEFAYSLPLVVGIGLYGVEIANLAIANLRVSQAALNLADNASRVGVDGSNASTQQLREIDVNDVLAGVQGYGDKWDLTKRGRITLTSLENRSGDQVIHWQRCLGVKSGANWDSSYGKPIKADGNYDPDAGVDTDAGTADNSASHPGTVSAGGMGDVSAKVIAPVDSGVMFVEINYDYKPVISTKWLPGGSARIHYIASFIVRDHRDFSQVYNPVATPVTLRATCDKYTAG